MLGDDAEYAMPPLTEWYQGHHDVRALVVDVLASRWRFRPAHATGQVAFGVAHEHHSLASRDGETAAVAEG
jgi:hypothetical protein